jgi:outer membrane protein OmpA-like peptidoglycan-associated protein
MITIHRGLIFFCLCILVLGCGTKKQAKSILLPQRSGETGKIIVRSDTSGIMLDKPYTEAVYHAATGGFLTRQTDPGEIQQIYGMLLAADPEDRSGAVTLFFLPGPADLTPDSRGDLQKIVDLARQNESAPIEITGHTDTAGSGEKNIQLSRARAHRVAEILQNHGIDPNRFSIQAKGETDLRIPTSDNTPEPGNRRVEVVIRQP